MGGEDTDWDFSNRSRGPVGTQAIRVAACRILLGDSILGKQIILDVCSREALICCNLQGELIKKNWQSPQWEVQNLSVPLLSSEHCVRYRTGVLLKKNHLVLMNMM